MTIGEKLFTKNPKQCRDIKVGDVVYDYGKRACYVADIHQGYGTEDLQANFILQDKNYLDKGKPIEMWDDYGGDWNRGYGQISKTYYTGNIKHFPIGERITDLSEIVTVKL